MKKEVPSPRADTDASAGSRASFWFQVLFGVLVGVPSCYFLQGLGFELLIKLKLITLEDAFEGWYSNEGLQRSEIWAVYIFLGLFFLGLTRWRRYSRFAWAAFWSHCVAGGICSALSSTFINF